MLKYILSKHTFKIVVLLYFFSTAFLLITYSNNNQKVSAQRSFRGIQLANFVKIKDLIIPVDLAITPDQQAMGLSFRNSLNASQGMLFPFLILLAITLFG